MMKRHLFTIVALLCVFVCTTAQEKASPVKFNYGVKLGFQGVTYNTTDFSIDGYTLNGNTIQSNKVGYTVTPFARLTKNKFYLQTEASFGIAYYNYDFTDASAPSSSAEYKLTTYCIKVPLLFGYNFISYDKYGMSFYTGPRVKFNITPLCDQKFTGFKYNDMREELEKREWFWETGLGIRIYNVVIDIAYDWGFLRGKSKIHTPDDDLVFDTKRNSNILSFSAGFIF